MEKEMGGRENGGSCYLYMYCIYCSIIVYHGIFIFIFYFLSPDNVSSFMVTWTSTRINKIIL